MKRAKLAAYGIFILLVAAACYLRPLPEDFDRYVYEALVRSERQPLDQIYPIVKHESPRAEASMVMDSPGHLAQLEPLYAIRPLYIEIASMLSRLGVPPQKSIDLVSAGSLFCLALLVWAATRSYAYSALLVMAPSVLVLGRIGGPDALSTLVVVAGLLAVLDERLFVGLALLAVSVWIRTDNVLIVLAVLGWLVWGHKLKSVYAVVLALLGVASVEWINVLSGNYGWKVLLHYSFVGGRYPAEIVSGISLAQYAKTFATNAPPLLTQVAPWLLLGIAAWKLGERERSILVPVGIACGLHYALFPSSEARYLAWACVICGILFVCALMNQPQKVTFPLNVELRAQAEIVQHCA